MYLIASASKNSLQIHEYSRDNIQENSKQEIQNIKQIQYSPGKQLLVNSNKCTVDDEVLDLDVDLCCFGYRSARLLYIASKELMIYDLYKQKTIDSVNIDKLKCIAASCDDSKIAGGLKSGNIFIYSLKYKTSNTLESKSICNSLCFYPFKKSILLCGFEDGSVYLYDLLKGTPISTKQSVHSGPVSGK